MDPSSPHPCLEVEHVPPEGADEQYGQAPGGGGYESDCPLRLIEKAERPGKAPIKQREFFKIGDTVQPRGDHISGLHHLTRDFSITGLIGVKQRISRLKSEIDGIRKQKQGKGRPKRGSRSSQRRHGGHIGFRTQYDLNQNPYLVSGSSEYRSRNVPSRNDLPA